jgi:hypothetical protein
MNKILQFLNVTIIIILFFISGFECFNLTAGELPYNPDSYWDLKVTLDDNSGRLRVTTFCLTSKYLELDINHFYRTSLDHDDFKYNFHILPFDIRNPRREKLANAINIDSANNIPPVICIAGQEHISMSRKIRLYKGERFFKEVIIWELYFWDKLFETLNKNRDLSFDITENGIYRVSIDNQTREIDFRFKIDYQTAFKMQQLRNKLKVKNNSKDNAPQWKGSIQIDHKTGRILLLVSNYSKKTIRFDLDENFNDSHFFKKFTFAQKTTPSNNATNTILSGQSLPVFTEENSTDDLRKIRIVDLKENETVGKETEIWNIEIWNELIETLQKNKLQKYLIEFPVQVEIDQKLVIQSVDVEIDLGVVNAIELLRKNQKPVETKL